MSEALTVIERNNLVELEATIQKNLTAFYEVGFALMQIRDNRLYREIYGTFEEYCKEKWNFTRSYAYRLIASSEVADNLSPVGDIPESERVVRPLTRIKDPDQQREVYQRAVETAPEGKVTARHIEETVKEVIERKEPEKKVYQIHKDGAEKERRVDRYQNIRPKPEIVSSRFMSAYENMQAAIRNERALGWKGTSMADAEKYVQFLLDELIP